MVIPDLSLEKFLWEKGFANVAGTDEVGRGSLAGPVVAGAVIIHSEKQAVSSVRDSKLMSSSQREKAYHQISRHSSAWGTGIVSAQEIDEIGIQRAVRKAMLLALAETEEKFGIKINHVLVDGSRTQSLKKYSSRRIKAGGLYHYSISAASIVAKVTRDRIMKQLASEFPQYGFERHVGYGTKAHFEAIKTHGPLSLHRKSFL